MCNGPIQAGGWHAAQPQWQTYNSIAITATVCSVNQESSFNLSRKTLFKYHSGGKYSVLLPAEIHTFATNLMYILKLTSKKSLF